MNNNMIKLIVLLLTITALWSCEIEVPDKDIIEAWQENNKTIVPDYSEFQGHWSNDDINSHIWSYICPPDLTQKNAFDILKSQNSEFYVHNESDSLLSLRIVRAHYGPEEFSEFRFLYDSRTGVMTVLIANKNSELPMSYHSRLINLQDRYHRRRVLPRELLLSGG